MARITVEDCLKNVNNRFTLIHMAARRVRQLRKDAEPTILSRNKDIVVALREIAAGHVTVDENAEPHPRLEESAETAAEDFDLQGEADGSDLDDVGATDLGEEDLAELAEEETLDLGEDDEFDLGGEPASDFGDEEDAPEKTEE